MEATAVAQSVRAFACRAEGWVFESQSQVLRDDHYRQMPKVTVSVAR